MRSQLQSPRSQSRISEDANGFTMVELMVVVVIVGLLSSVALPSFLNQQNKAKAACAETQVSGLAKEQQVYFAENNSFANNFQELGHENSAIPSGCNQSHEISLDNSSIKASPTDTANGLCVQALLTNGSYTMKKIKGACA